VPIQLRGGENVNEDQASDPLLLRLARAQQASTAARSRYDDQLDELLVEHCGDWVPAADLPHGPPKTKKNDIEKGEDVKGRW
jgi:hypothetical protein